jgi:microcystin-dependent protein
MPAGTIISYAGSIAAFTSTAMADSTTLIHKDGWAVCNGASVPKATYSQLFARLSTVWNAATNPLTGSAQSAPADATNNFRVPNLQGTFLRGVGNFTDDTKDATLAGFQSSQNLSHTHNTFTDSSTLKYGGTTGGSSYFSVTNITNAAGGDVTNVASGSTESRPQNVGVYYLIKLYDNLAAVDVYIPAASATTTGLISREYTYSGSALTLTYPGGGRNGNSFASGSMYVTRIGTGYFISIQGSMNIAAANARTTYILSNTGFSWPAGTPALATMMTSGSMQNASG